eukprot:72805-Rhodomonas_salina.4
MRVVVGDSRLVVGGGSSVGEDRGVLVGDRGVFVPVLGLAYAAAHLVRGRQNLRGAHSAPV